MRWLYLISALIFLGFMLFENDINEFRLLDLGFLATCVGYSCFTAISELKKDNNLK